MGQNYTKQLVKNALKKKKPKPNRFKTSIYVDQEVFNKFKKALQRGEVSEVLEDFMRQYVELKEQK